MIYCQVYEQVLRRTIVEWLAHLSQAQLEDRLAGCLVRMSAGITGDGQQLYLVSPVLSVVQSSPYKYASAPPAVLSLQSI